jgi:predicted porin
MKSIRLAGIALVACGSVQAQSSVTLFGLIDAGVARTSATGNGHSTGMESGGGLTSRLGFRGKEDLGGGLSTSFWLEGGLNNDVGSGATQTSGIDFSRRSTVSLAGHFGEIRLGRDYTMTYMNMGPFDAFSQRGFGAIENLGPTRSGTSGYVRVSNSIGYLAPENLDGFYGGVQYAFSEQDSNKINIANADGTSSSAIIAATEKTNSYYGARLGYAAGGLNVAAGYGVFPDMVRSVGSAFFPGDYKIANVGASYDFGFIKAMFLYQKEKQKGRGSSGEFNFQTLSLGATAPLGAGLVRAQLARYDQSNSSDDVNEYSVGYLYNLSTRTRLYGSVVRLVNRGSGRVALNNISSSVKSPAPTPGGKSMGYVIGVMHTF